MEAHCLIVSNALAYCIYFCCIKSSKKNNNNVRAETEMHRARHALSSTLSRPTHEFSDTSKAIWRFLLTFRFRCTKWILLPRLDVRSLSSFTWKEGRWTLRTEFFRSCREFVNMEVYRSFLASTMSASCFRDSLNHLFTSINLLVIMQMSHSVDFSLISWNYLTMSFFLCI